MRNLRDESDAPLIFTTRYELRPRGDVDGPGLHLSPAPRGLQAGSRRGETTPDSVVYILSGSAVMVVIVAAILIYRYISRCVVNCRGWGRWW